MRARLACLVSALVSLPAFAGVVTPLTNARGVALVDGTPVHLRTENGELQFVREGVVTTLAFPAHGATLAASGPNLLVVYIQGSDVKALMSGDGGASWSTTTTLVTSHQGKTPAACLWTARGQVYGMAAWSNGPAGSWSTLHAAHLASGRWGTVTRVDVDNAAEDANAPALACSPQLVRLYWRQGVTEVGGVEIADVRQAAFLPGSLTWTSPATLVENAYDPSACRSGSTVLLGYHAGFAAWLAVSSDGGRSFGPPTMLDATGRFVSVDCDGGVAAVSWADYDTLTVATADDHRRLGFAYTTDRGATWVAERPAGEDTHQVLGTVDADGSGRVAVVWTDRLDETATVAAYP